MHFDKILYGGLLNVDVHSQCPRVDLDKRFLPRPFIQIYSRTLCTISSKTLADFFPGPTPYFIGQSLSNFGKIWMKKKKK